MDAQPLRRRELQGQAQPTPLSLRKPQRVSITIPWRLYEKLLRISDQQGRSLSKIACYWLERQADLHARADQL
jgi:hypothetical protein